MRPVSAHQLEVAFKTARRQDHEISPQLFRLAVALIHAAHSVYQPNKVVLGNTGPVEPFAKTLPTKEVPVVYLCTGTACQPPTGDATTLRTMLK